MASERTRLFYFAFRVAPGGYSMRIVISNEYGGDRHSSTVNLNVPSFREAQVQISSLQLARHVERSEPEATSKKRGLSIMPNVAHIFSSENPVCLLYFEAYNVASISSPADSFQVCCRLSRSGREVRSFTMKHPKTGMKALVGMKLDLANLAPGEYMLTAEVLDRNGKRQAGAAAVLFLAPPHVIFGRMPGDMLE